MPRSGSGTHISYGSDASLDDFSLKSILFHMAGTVALAATADIVTKSDGALTPSGWLVQVERGADSGHVRFVQDFSVTDGTWVTPNDTIVNWSSGRQPHAIAVTYDRGSTANDPNIYIDGVLQAETEASPPNGTGNGDAAANLRNFTNDALTRIFQGRIGNFVYDDVLMTAADVNRHRWRGRAPGGPSTMSVWVPMWTTDQTNKGSATITVTDTGTAQHSGYGSPGSSDQSPGTAKG